MRRLWFGRDLAHAIMSSPHLVLISGWARGAESMQALEHALCPACTVTVTCPQQLAQVARDLERARVCEPLADERDDSASPYARGLAALMDGCARPCILCGWSMGGLIAMETALHYRDRVRGLALIATSGRFVTGDGYPCGTPESQIRAMGTMLRGDAQRVLTEFFMIAHKPHMLAPGVALDLADTAVCAGVDGLIDGLDYLRRTDLRAELSRLDLPARVYHGTADAIIPVEAGPALVNHLNRAQLLEYEGEGHCLPERCAEELAADMRDALY